MNDRFDELLPWYVNGTLGAEDKEWVERYIAAHPESQAEVAWYRSLATKIRDTAPAVPDSIGLAQVMTLVRGDRPTLAERFTGFFGALGMRPAAAFAGIAIFAVQGAIILNLMNAQRDVSDEIRVAKATVVEDRPMLKLNFAPDAKESDIRMLLVSVQGRLAGGPGQLGDYYVVVPSGKEATIAEQIKSSPIVQAVTLAPGVPPRE